MHNYIINNSKDIVLNGNVVISKEELLLALNQFTLGMKQISETSKSLDIDIFGTLGLRNLSGFVGEVFASMLNNSAKTKFTKNPHQDGYPDLLWINTQENSKYYESLISKVNGKIYPKNKADFSPFKYGGLEVKATCGNTPPAESGQPKPIIGETRIALMKRFDWKAHHRETNNLIAILWDFIDELPTVIACFYSDELTEEDWGNIVQPKSGGGRTTSVSIMKSQGIRKMCANWIAIINEDIYLDKLSAKKWIGYNPKATDIK